MILEKTGGRHYVRIDIDDWQRLLSLICRCAVGLSIPTDDPDMRAVIDHLNTIAMAKDTARAIACDLPKLGA